MPGSVKSWKAVVLAFAVCLLLLGASLTVRSAHQPAQAAGTASSDASPEVSASAVVPSSAAAATPSSTPSSSPSPPSSPFLSPSQDPIFDSSVIARAAELRRLARKAQALSRLLTARPVAEFTMANFNIQGASHRGGITGRTRHARDLLLSHGVDVVALQEFQRPQRQIFARIAGGTYDVFPNTTGRSVDAEDSVAWRKDTFELVRGETRPYRYFLGAIRN
ncbi:MAG: endonuclease/exonuclease/phosphatase family protein, partial [Marmoricola sp.]